MELQLEIDRTAIAAFCSKWKIEDLSFFGSVLRPTFGPASDVDVLVRFAEDAEWTLLDQVRMEDELSSLLGRSVDLVSRRGIERSANWIRRQAILESAEPFYVAG